MTVPAAAAVLGEGAAVADTVTGAAARRAPKTGKRAAARPARAPAKKAVPVKAPAARKAAPAGRGKGGGRKVTPLGRTTLLNPGPGAAHRLVIAEFLLSAVLLLVGPILLRKPGKDGKMYSPNDFVRASALALVFFILALLSNSPKSSRFAAAFGALVTLGVTYHATGAVQAVGAVFAAAKQTGGAAAAPAPGTATVTTAVYHPLDPTGQPGTTVVPEGSPQAGAPAAPAHGPVPV